ncbi:MAG: endonuclease V [Polyangiaceae bacterium]
MLVAVDAQYADSHAGVACVGFDDWPAETPVFERTSVVRPIEPYTPGEFRRRELPCILKILAELPAPPAVVVIDGYVLLDSHGRKGLGAYLFDALDGQCAVVGVAKKAFHDSPHARIVLRGQSAQPLFVTAQGLSLDDAERAIRAMAGPFRIPTLLRRVDQLARAAVLQES